MSYAEFNYTTHPSFKKYQKDQITREKWDKLGAPVITVSISFNSNEPESMVVNANDVATYYGDAPVDFKTLVPEKVFVDMFNTENYLENMLGYKQLIQKAVEKTREELAEHLHGRVNCDDIIRTEEKKVLADFDMWVNDPYLDLDGWYYTYDDYDFKVEPDFEHAME